LPLLDRQLFTILNQIAGVFRANAPAIWGDYRPDQTPVVYAHWSTGDAEAPDHAYVLNASNPVATGDAQLLPLPAELGLPPVYRITRGPGMDAAKAPNGTVGSADVAGERTSIIGFSTPASWILDPSTWLFGRVMVHESFHAYQSTWKVDGDGDQSWPEDYPRDVENAALALLEDAVLELPPGQCPSTARQALDTYLAIRAARQDALPEVGSHENFYHQMEGLARFAEDRYVRLGGHRIADRSKDLTTGPKLLQWIGRTRGYSAGAGCGELLESVVGPRWRSQAPQGKAPADIAAAILGAPTGTRRDQLIADAKKRFDYAKLRAMVEAADLPNADTRP
jgi:hypothetical protein